MNPGLVKENGFALSSESEVADTTLIEMSALKKEEPHPNNKSRTCLPHGRPYKFTIIISALMNGYVKVNFCHAHQ